MAACLTLIMSEYLAKSAAGWDVRRASISASKILPPYGAYEGRVMARD